MLGRAERGFEGGSVVVGRSRFSGTGNRADLSVAINDAQSMSAPFEDIDVGISIDGNGSRVDEWRLAGYGAIQRLGEYPEARIVWDHLHSALNDAIDDANRGVPIPTYRRFLDRPRTTTPPIIDEG